MQIASATAADSNQMRSIALVTMVFLPGTFFAVSLVRLFPVYFARLGLKLKHRVFSQ